MVAFNGIEDNSYFEKDGVKFPKNYEARKVHVDKVDIISLGRNEAPMLTIRFSEISINGTTPTDVDEAVSLLNEILFKKGGGAAGEGVADTFIPLTGTEESKPLDGKIWIKGIDGLTHNFIGFDENNDWTGIFFRNGNYGDDASVSLHAGGVNIHGKLTSNDYHLPTYNNQYIQKKYVDSAINEITPSVAGEFVVGNGTTTPTKRGIIGNDLSLTDVNRVPYWTSGGWLTGGLVVSTNPSGNSLVGRDSLGRITASNAVNNNQLVPLGQINSLIEAYLKGLPSYNATASQALEHDSSGNIKWVNK